MAFWLLFLCGVAGGVPGGMGMGGGTALIPLLALVCGLPQHTAQGLNLLSFLPMSLIALSVHIRARRVEGAGLLALVPGALLFSALGALLSVCLPAALLRRAFGAFLLVLSLAQGYRLLRGWQEKRAHRAA